MGRREIVARWLSLLALSVEHWALEAVVPAFFFICFEVVDLHCDDGKSRCSMRLSQLLCSQYERQ